MVVLLTMFNASVGFILLLIELLLPLPPPFVDVKKEAPTTARPTSSILYNISFRGDDPFVIHDVQRFMPSIGPQLFGAKSPPATVSKVENKSVT